MNQTEQESGLPFKVPVELEPLVDERVLAVHEQWQGYDLADARHQKPKAEVVTITKDEKVRVAVLNPKGGGETTIVLELSHAQTWKPSMFIRAEITRQIVDPEARMIVFPNNSLADDYYELDGKQRRIIAGGNLRPLAEMQARALEALHVTGLVAITGYSLGGLTGPALAAVGSDKFEVTHINADEAPNKQRSVKQLKKDFMSSGGWGPQRKAIADANLPVLSQALSVPRMAMDYAVYGAQHLFDSGNRTLVDAMTRPRLIEDLERARKYHPSVVAKLGYVAASVMFGNHDVYTRRPGIRLRQYKGDASYMHSTVDNVMAHALMVKDGFRPRFRSRA